jgi:hypothetical protein
MKRHEGYRSQRILRAHVLDDPAGLVYVARKSRVTTVELTFDPGQEPWFQRRRAVLQVVRPRATVVPVVADVQPGSPIVPSCTLGLGPVISARWGGSPAHLDAAILQRRADASELLHAYGISRQEAGAVVRRMQGRHPRSFLKANQWLEEAALCGVAEALRQAPDVRLFLGARALVQGRINEIDVLVRRGSRAVVIECKAFRSASGALLAFCRKLGRFRVPPTPEHLAQHEMRVVRVVAFIPALRGNGARQVSPLVRDGFEPYATLASDAVELARAVRDALWNP